MSIFRSFKSFGIVAFILAIVAVVLAFIFITPEKKRPKLNKFGQFVHDTLNFKYLIVEKILQALYMFFTAYVILTGFFMLFMVEDGYFEDRWLGGYGLLVMIVGPIAIRLVYELLMMAVLLVKNVISINNKLKNQNGGAESGNPFAAPSVDTFKDMLHSASNNAPQNGYAQGNYDPNVYAPNQNVYAPNQNVYAPNQNVYTPNPNPNPNPNSNSNERM